MDKEYEGYFAARVQRVSTTGPETLERLLRAVGPIRPEIAARTVAREAIEAARRELPPDVRLRSDGELALYVLALELAARPVLTVEQPSIGELSEDLAADAVTVARRASELAPETEISAHRVVDGLSQSWDELKTSRWRVWDRHNR
jgi:hypothetical protein